MKTRKIILFAVMVISVALVAHQVAANTLSDAYYLAFTSPRGFDAFVDQQIRSNGSYLAGFADCVNLAIPLLERMEWQLNQQYASCYYNDECTQIAKQIQSVRELRVNVGNLYAFARDKTSNADLTFTRSNIGQAALILERFSNQYGIPVDRNPVFQSQMAVLSSVGCP